MTKLSVRGRRTIFLQASLIITLLLLAGCGRSQPTPTPVPSSTGVTIPSGFTVKTDNALGYTLALPAGWTEFDLRSDRIQGMVGKLGFDEELEPLNEILDSPAGQAIGMLAMTDLTAIVRGGVPTLLNVSVVDSPGATPESVLSFVQGVVDSADSSLGAVQIDSLEAATINNLPAVQGKVTLDLSSAGLDKQMIVKLVGLIANDKVYALTLATDANKWTDNEPVFAEIISTFRPE